MIVALEGAPATGKTTVANYLVEHHGASRIPEVNELHPVRPHPEPEYWYCMQQITRADRARESATFSVLDGDVFQPVWFSWLYPTWGLLEWQKALQYFQDKSASTPAPSFYVYLYVDPKERHSREHARCLASGRDARRATRKFSRYEGMLGPQKAYFDKMSDAFPGYVLTIFASELSRVASAVLEFQPATAPGTRELLDWMSVWLDEHRPCEFNDRL